LDESQPDVVCLQELNAPGEKFPAAAIEAAGYRSFWRATST
jgi:exodeoxyribonuclease III